MKQDELPGIPKKPGRPKTSTLSRKEQIRRAVIRHRKKKKAEKNSDYM